MIVPFIYTCQTLPNSYLFSFSPSPISKPRQSRLHIRTTTRGFWDRVPNHNADPTRSQCRSAIDRSSLHINEYTSQPSRELSAHFACIPANLSRLGMLRVELYIDVCRYVPVCVDVNHHSTSVHWRDTIPMQSQQLKDTKLWMESPRSGTI